MADIPFAQAFKGLHYDFINTALPPWLTATHPQRFKALHHAARRHPIPPTSLPRPLKQAVDAHWQNLNALDGPFQGLNDVYAYAEAKLRTALAQDYGDIDVKNTFLRTYVSAAQAWWVIDVTQGVTSRTVSLLDAALHNFADNEQFVDYAFLSRPDARGQQRSLSFTHKVSGAALTVEGFKQLCRRLDIGAQYQAQLKRALGFEQRSVAYRVRQHVLAQQKSGLSAAAQLAAHKGDIPRNALAPLLALAAGQPAVEWEGQPLHCHTLDMMNTRLTGIILLHSPPSPPTPLTQVIAYVPDDPEHPLKHYPSPQAFMAELTRQLRDVEHYQVFFSRFVAHDQRGYFFANLNARLSRVQWHHKAPTDSQPSWKDTPVEHPHLQFNVQRFEHDYQNRSTVSTQNDLWNYLYRVRLNKIVNDAQSLAVSTHRVDRMARWAWWDNLEKIFSDLLNVAVQILTPFIPGLGELMLAYTAYQLTDEVFEGIVDWAEGQAREAVEHIFGVAQNLLQLGTFAAGAQVAQPLHLKLSAFVEGLKAVQLPDGRTRLWNPEISPYADPSLQLPAQARAEPSGLHRHQGQALLRRDGEHFRVRYDAERDEHRIVHPRRPDAYQPRVQLKRDGIVLHEAEHPQTWDRPTLLRRLGRPVEGLSVTQLERIRRISGCDDDLLRGIYHHDQPLPPLLEDTLNRFDAYASASRSSDSIRVGQPLDPASAWFEQTVTELPGWPANKALQVYLRADLTGASHHYGNPDAAPADTLQMSLAQVMSGTLPERVLAFLDEPQTEALLGQHLPKPQRLQHLRNLLADYVSQQAPDIGPYMHRLRELSDEPRTRLLREHFPRLESHAIDALLSSAGSDELRVMDEHQRVPLRLKNLAGELDFVARTTHAYEGFYFPWQQTPDSERMVLNTLKHHSDAFADLHLQIRERTADGPLRCEAGPMDAQVRRTLIRKGNHGYEVLDDQLKHLHGPDTLYESILQALPDPTRHALGYTTGQGSALRGWLMQTLEPLAERRIALAEPPTRARANRETLALLGTPMPKRTARGPTQPSADLHREALKTLFPYQSEERIQTYMDTVGPQALGETINTLVVERIRLNGELSRWALQPGAHSLSVERELRAFISARILECWDDQVRARVEHRGSVLDLSGLVLPDALPTLQADFGHVVGLNLARTRFKAEHADFLARFPALRTLDLTHNPLTHLPDTLVDLRHLENLDLSYTLLQLRARDVTRLKNLRYLRRLKLNHTPTRQVPDIGRMRDLHELDLSRTPIERWPDGVFDVPRPPHWLLNLQDTAITEVPEVELGSPAALVVARTRLDRARLGAVSRERFRAYRESVGLDADRSYEPRGESEPWLAYLDATAQDAARALWSRLEHEHGSQGFFEVIKALEAPDEFQSAEDEQRYTANHRTLTQQVWELLEAADADTALRLKLFEMASYPANCADAGTQIFNELGVEVLVHQIERYAPSPEVHEQRLAVLCRGIARLRQLNDVARADIRQRLAPLSQGGQGLRLRSEIVDNLPGEVDEVEVYLAYQTALAQRLDLPWIADHMIYRLTANVSEAQIDSAYRQVLELGEGDGLVNRMLLDPHWRGWLEQRYPERHAQHQQRLKTRHGQLYELQDLHDQWRRAPTPEALQQMQDLATLLGISDGQLQGDDAAFQAACERLEETLGYDALAWMREQTRNALRDAGDWRNRAPKR